MGLKIRAAAAGKNIEGKPQEALGDLITNLNSQSKVRHTQSGYPTSLIPGLTYPIQD